MRRRVVATRAAAHAHNQRAFGRRQVAQLAVGEAEGLNRAAAHGRAAGAAAVGHVGPAARVITSRQQRVQTLALASADTRRRRTFSLSQIKSYQGWR